MRRAAVVVAGGTSSRFGSGTKKEFALLDGEPVLRRAARPFFSDTRFDLVVIVIARDLRDAAKDALGEAFAADPRLLFADAGERRADSVRAGLEALEDRDIDVALVHDGARPWLDASLVDRVLEAAERHGACVPVVPVTDTIKELGADGRVTGHPPRARLGAAQTPQGFRYRELLAAHRSLRDSAGSFTDDAELAAAAGMEVVAVEGDRRNAKITWAEDLRSGAGAVPRVGLGQDIHALVPGRRLLLAGVEIPHDRGEDGWSDGDALAHAVTDAVLGAAALGDIGTHFPPSDPRWKDADSMALLRRAVALAREAGWLPSSLDCTVSLERPRLSPHVGSIRSALASSLGIPEGAVSAKAKTREGFDSVGQGLAVEAFATVVLVPAS